MKRILILVILCLSLFMLLSCNKIDNPTTSNCYNFRCEITMDGETFIISGDNAHSIKSKCNEYESTATLASNAIGSGECIKIKFMGDKKEKPKKDSDTVVFYTYTIHSNNVVSYEGKMDLTYQFADGFYQTIDFLIFLKK